MSGERRSEVRRGRRAAGEGGFGEKRAEFESKDALPGLKRTQNSPQGSISVAHTGPGPNLMRYFACVVRVLGAFCLSSQEVPCWCLCPSWFRNVKTAHGSGVLHPSGICVKPLQSSSGSVAAACCCCLLLPAKMKQTSKGSTS